MLSAVRLGVLPPLPADLLERAVALAAQADVALVFAGLSSEWESEGYDRADMELPGRAERADRAGRRGQPQHRGRAQRGLGRHDALAGQGGGGVAGLVSRPGSGNAIADVLFGDVNPSGKLPQTFPAAAGGQPRPISTTPARTATCSMASGIFVGYRYYEKKRIAPLFPFGFGLSYTTFAYDNLRLSATNLAPGETLKSRLM